MERRNPTERDAPNTAESGVFVLGMREAGSPALARWVGRLGVAIVRGESGAPADEADDREPPALDAFNERLLRRLGGTESAPPLVAEGWASGPRLERERAAGRRLFLRSCGAAPWVWDDRRNAILLPFWVAALRVRPVVILWHRNPLEIAASLAKSGGFSKALSLALWERYARSALASARGLPVAIVRHRDLLADPSRVAGQLRAFLAEHGVASRDSTGEHLDDLSDPGSVDVAASDDFEADPDVSEAQRDLFRLLESLGSGGDAFEPGSLPSEARGTEALLAERRRADLLEAERRRLEIECSRLERAAGFLLARTPLAGSLGVAGGGSNPAAAPYGPDAREDVAGYRAWIERRHAAGEGTRPRASETARAPDGAVLAIRMRLDRPDPRLLAGAIDSVRSQSDPRWRLGLFEKSWDGPPLETWLDQSGLSDPRIRVANGPWEGSDGAEAGGEFVCVLGQHDLLADRAVAEIAAEVAQVPDVDAVYTDEDRIDEGGARSEPFFKPDWSPDHLLSQMYVGRLLVVRRGLFEEIGGFRAASGAAEEYDLALRATERAKRVAHVPQVLYHARATGAGRADRMSAGACGGAARSALEEALRRRGIEGEVASGLAPDTYRVKRRLRSDPLVSIIIPFRDRADLLRRSIDSLDATVRRERWEAILVDNQSWEPETTALLDRLSRHSKCRVLRYPEAFNWAAINNWAVRHCRGEVLLFLNDDVEATSEGWLSAMLEHAQREEVGAVGARLLYPDGRVQHAGVLLGDGGRAGHAFRFCPGDSAGYFAMAKVIRNVSAVTGACLMVRRPVFEETRGFDEVFDLAYNDVDFCLRLRRRGYWIVYTPFAELIHHELATRGVAAETAAVEEMTRRWGDSLQRDPYHNPNLSRRREDYSLRLEDEVDPCPNP